MEQIMAESLRQMPNNNTLAVSVFVCVIHFSMGLCAYEPGERRISYTIGTIQHVGENRQIDASQPHDIYFFSVW